MRDDHDLLTRLAGGDSSALSELFERYSRPVYARAFVEIESRSDAEELLQDAFLLLWKKRKRLELTGDSILPWLLVTVHYLASNLRRQRRRRPTVSIETQPEGMSGYDPATIVARGEFEAVVQESVRKLPPLDQAIFRLCVVEGFSYKQAAHRLKTSHAVVRNRLSRSKGSVRADINAYMAEDKR